MITADDFGFGFLTSLGIMHAHLHGPVNRTSVIVVTGDHVKKSVQLLDAAPNLQLGLHLVFTDVGDRALAATWASGLVNRQRRFWSISCELPVMAQDSRSSGEQQGSGEVDLGFEA